MAGIDGYTKLMLHCDGADESTSFPDASASNHTVTANGNAQVDTAQKVFGTGSGLFDAVAGTFLSIPNSADFNFGDGDFTIDFRLRFISTANPQVFMGRNGTSDHSFACYYNSGNLRFAGYWNGSTQDEGFAWTPSINTWYHIAFIRNGANLKVHVNGIQVGSTYNISNYAIRDASSIFYLGENVEDLGYRLNGYMDEIRISKGIARWTTDFTPPTEAYKETLTLDADETLQVSDEISFITNPETLDADETLSLSDEISFLKNPEDIDADESIALAEDVSFTLVELTDYGSQIIFLNPLIFVTNSDPAKIASIDITDPANPVKTAQELVGCTYAKGVVYNATNEYFYVICAEGKVCKVNKNDLTDQTIINTGETDIMQYVDSLNTFFKTYTTTDDSDGEIVMIDEREIEKINTDLRWLESITKKISTRLNWILGKIVDTDLRWLATQTSKIKTNLRWLKYSYATVSQYPVDYTDLVVKINGVDLVPLDDIDMDSFSVTHDVNAEELIGSNVTFTLNRRHDRLDLDNQGNASQITNQNDVIVQINGITEFTGKVANLNCNSELETVTVIAIGTRPTDKRHTVSIPLSSVNEQLNLYHCIMDNPIVDNPYIDPTDEDPQYFKGIEVDLGTEIKQNILRYSSFLNTATLAEKLESGDWKPKQNWSYFWLASFKHLILGLTQGTLRYIGTSIRSLSTDAWEIITASYKYQKELDDTETELGVYQVGSAPYDVQSHTNGRKIVKDKWEDRKDGLYLVRDEGYDYEQYAKDVADLEYQKILNINGNVLPITSCSISLSIDAYYYYNLGLLTRLNLTNTTTANIYNNANGFPVAVKTITIKCATQGENSMLVTLNCDNQKSQVELDEIDDLYPDEESEEYLFPEKAVKIHRKFDPNAWGYPS